VLKADIIKQARNMILRSIELVYPSGINVSMMHQTLCTVDECYDFALMRKDVAYLIDEGYINLVGLMKNPTMADVKEDSMTIIKLTASGLEIAQNLKDDPALEF